MLPRLHAVGCPIKPLLWCDIPRKAPGGGTAASFALNGGRGHPVCKVVCFIYLFCVCVCVGGGSLAVGEKCKFHQGRACESRAAKIVVIYLNICLCMACCFGSPEDMQRRGMWQTDGAGGIDWAPSAQLCSAILLLLLLTIHPRGVGSVTPPWEPDEVGQALSLGLTTGSRAAPAAAADDDDGYDDDAVDSLITHMAPK